MYKLFSIFLIHLFFSNYSISQSSKPPKLVVGIVVDQMCYDYLYRFQARFSKGGFRKLMENGVNCRNNHVCYSLTHTAPGHASIYTGTIPANHKIVSNFWFDRKKKKIVNCLDDSLSVKSIRNLNAITITDQLKLTYPNAKVYSISLKDRSAILSGGHLSDGSFWYDEKQGKLTSNNLFSNSSLNWVEDFNIKNCVKSAINCGWEPIYKTGSYASWYKDSSSYEENVFNSNQFPYILKNKFSDKEEYKLFTYLPAANTMLTDFSIQLIKNQKLGNDEIPDFLCLSYSSTDILGHAFGPYSHEVEDMYLRLDLELSRLLKYLEKKIGKDNFVLFLTADHAVLPVPQMLVDLKLPGGYFNEEVFINELRLFLLKKYNFDFLSKILYNNIYLDRELISKNNFDYNQVVSTLKKYIEEKQNIFKVLTSSEIKLNTVKQDYWNQMIFNSFDDKISGDIVYILTPGFLPVKNDSDVLKKGTAHISPFGYDSQVPLIFYGKKIKPKEIFRKTEIIDIVPTIVPFLNISNPSTSLGKIIIEVFEK